MLWIVPLGLLWYYAVLILVPFFSYPATFPDSNHYDKNLLDIGAGSLFDY